VAGWAMFLSTNAHGSVSIIYLQHVENPSSHQEMRGSLFHELGMLILVVIGTKSMKYIHYFYLITAGLSCHKVLPVAYKISVYFNLSAIKKTSHVIIVLIK
jgi:hypothetical protein